MISTPDWFSGYVVIEGKVQIMDEDNTDHLLYSVSYVMSIEPPPTPNILTGMKTTKP